MGAPLANAGLATAPQDPHGFTIQSITPSTPAGSPETMLSPLLPLEPFLHLLTLSLEKGRINPFWGNLLYLQGSCPNETGEAIPTHNLAASHLSGSKQGQPWPRTFSTRDRQAPPLLSQASNKCQRVLGCEGSRGFDLGLSLLSPACLSSPSSVIHPFIHSTNTH